MTFTQLTELQKLLDKVQPGWKVARGGILMEPSIGRQEVYCNGSDDGVDDKMIVVDFDTMTIVGV